ncbi:MAG: hypothetical protein LBT62_02030, partial [Deltaproteobacteria bacterium]|nr:hypothetical protein [Deltaproteobacteria bacterium]
FFFVLYPLFFFGTTGPVSLPQEEVTAPIAPPQEEEAAPFDIPQDAFETNDLSFLGGCWDTSANGLFNTVTKQPIIHTYCFDEEGTGTVNIDEYDENKVYVDSCRAPAHASLQDDELHIDVPDLVQCQNSDRRYQKPQITCRRSGSDVVCIMDQKTLKGVKFIFVPSAK